MKGAFKLFFFILICSNLLSCVMPRKLKYAAFSADNSADSALNLAPLPDYAIHPYDELYIKIITTEENIGNFLEYHDSNNTSIFANNIDFVSYTVSDSGYIRIPFIGKIMVKDMNLQEAKQTIKKQLEDYFATSEVIIKLVDKNITILGEVNRPGKQQLNRQSVNIFQALGMAGDVTIYANRSKVLLMREVKNTTVSHYLDLTDKNIVKSEYYYVLPNDVIYVEPLQVKSWSLNTSTYATTLSLITALLTISYFFIKK